MHSCTHSSVHARVRVCVHVHVRVRVRVRVHVRARARVHLRVHVHVRMRVRVRVHMRVRVCVREYGNACADVNDLCAGMSSRLCTQTSRFKQLVSLYTCMHILPCS